MTHEEFKKKKYHDCAGINDGKITPALKGWYWCLRYDPNKGTTLHHAEKLEDL